MRWQTNRLHLTLLIAAWVMTGCAKFAALKPFFEDSQSDEAANHQPYQLFSAERARYNLNYWQLSGRITLKSNNEAWSGTLRWRQENDQFVIHFNAPLGQGAIHINGDRDGVELHTADGSSFEAEDIDTLLSDATGWDLPLSGLKYWILGIPNKNDSASIHRNKEFQIDQIKQSNWTVAIKRYQTVGENSVLPKKLILKNKKMNLRIIVGQWQLSQLTLANAIAKAPELNY